MSLGPVLKSSLRVEDLNIELWWPPQKVRMPAIIAIVKFTPAGQTNYELEMPLTYLLSYEDREGFIRVLSPGYDITPVAQSGMYNMAIARGLVNEAVETLIAFKLSDGDLDMLKRVLGEKATEAPLSLSIVGNLIDGAGSDKEHAHTLRTTLPFKVTREEVKHLL